MARVWGRLSSVFSATGTIMTRRFRVALLATAIILAPLAANAATPNDTRHASKPLRDDNISPAQSFPAPIHWALITVGVAFGGVAIYIYRRRGFHANAAD
jgi:hypothetical protein